MVLRQLQHEAAANILQGDTIQANVVMQELEVRGKALRWIKRNFKTNTVKEIAALMSQSPRYQDRELKVLITK